MLWGSVFCAAAVGATTLGPGNHYISVRVTNDTIIHVPPRAANSLAEHAGSAMPLVLALHGLGDNYPNLFQQSIKLDAVADEKGFITVYPLGSVSTFGTGITGHTWNGGKCCFSHAGR
jgi:poly(3-hydroxybutyrate) depolymerase